MSTCPHPHKQSYTSRAQALVVAKNTPRHKRVGLAPYRCQCGRWHLGRRIRRPLVAWRSEP